MDENPIQSPIQSQVQSISPVRPTLKSPLIILIVVGLAIAGYFVSTYYFNLYPFEQSTPPIPTFTLRPSPSPTQSISDTSTWKTYTNVQYGFEFKYPSTDKIDTVSRDIVRIDSPSKDNSDRDGFSAGEYFIEVSLFSNNKYEDYIGNIKTVDLDDYKIISGDRISAYFSPLSGYDTFIEKKGLTLVFAASLSDLQAKNEVTQILSTFKFIQSIDTSTWKTYTNTKYGFEFKYPANLFSSQDESAFVLKHSASNEEEPYLSFSFDKNINKLTVQQYYDGNPGSDLFGQSEGKFSKIIVAGIESFKFVPIVTFVGEVDIIIPTTKGFIRIIDKGTSFQANGLFDQILSTFKITP